MPDLYAGVGRRVINPPFGIKTFGFSSREGVVQAIESDLTATAVVLSDGQNKIVLIATDTGWMAWDVMSALRQRVGEAIGTPASHVMINLNHTHCSPSMPGWVPDEPAQIALQTGYQDDLLCWIVEAAQEANRNLQPARIGAEWGESDIGVYRREVGPDGRVFLGEVPDAPTDPSVGVIRVDNLDGQPLAILFSYGCHPVTIGPRSLVASPDFPGAARELIEKALGGAALFLQGCAGNIIPRGGMGFEVDCRDAKKRLGYELGAEVVKVASGIRTHVRRGERTSMGSLSRISLWPWVPVTDPSCSALGAVDAVVPLDFIELPPLALAEQLRDDCHRAFEEARARGARDWEINVTTRFADWSDKLVEAIKTNRRTLDVGIQAIRINNIALATISVEAFFETGLAVKGGSPFSHTQVLGYTNGCVCYLPRAEDFPSGGWDVRERYGIPDLLFQAYSLPVAVHPDSESRVVTGLTELLNHLAR